MKRPKLHDTLLVDLALGSPGISSHDQISVTAEQTKMRYMNLENASSLLPLKRDLKESQ